MLQLLCDGNPRAEVAAKLGIKEGTVKNHMHNVLTKMGSRTMLEALSMARSSGLVRETGPGPPTSDGLG
ncbi:MAG TPA: helix-turn-helix transcriptional regulator [Acidimicrobiales bacterium]|nr:helix-turn-helix transcriptional regulator [Acidimicrobiales bacterium]